MTESLCPICQDSGYVIVEVPVFADGGHSDVDQIEDDCPNCVQHVPALAA